MRRAARRVLAASGVLAWAALVGVTGPAAADTISCAGTGALYADRAEWPLLRLDPGRVATLASGSGVTVALIGPEVDPSNVQLAGHLARGLRVGDDPVPETVDCSGVGTMTAGLIVASPDARTPVVGLAPGATVLPIAVTDTDVENLPVVEPDRLAAAIDAAVGAGAGVICVVTASAEDSTKLRAAVAEAVAKDVVVISAGAADARTGQAVSATYPTAYPSVVGVVAVDIDDAPLEGADAGAHIDMAAPSTRLWSTAPTRGRSRRPSHQVLAGHPTAGVAYVAATAALVRSAFPAADREEVVHRIIATADPSAGGRSWGVVDPSRAVSAVLAPSTAGDSGSTGQLARLEPPSVVAASTKVQVAAVTVTAGALSLACVALVIGVRRVRTVRATRPGPAAP